MNTNAIEYVSSTGNLEQFTQGHGLWVSDPDSSEPVYQWVTMSELMSGDYRVTYLCNGVLAKGQPAIIGGPQKSFKTSLALELAICLATGTDFLGHFSVPEPVRVCYFSGEGGLGVMQDTLRRIGEAKGIDIGQIENLIVTDRVPQLDEAVHLEAIAADLEKYKPEVVFADPLYLALNGADTSNVFSMGERLRRLNEICLPHGCTPVLLHHLRKNRINPYSPAGLEDLSMSGFAEYAGQWVLLSRRTAYNPDDPTHRLWITLGGRTGHGSQWGLNIHEGVYESETGRVWQADLQRQDEIHAEARDEASQKKADREQSRQTEFEVLCNRALAWIKNQAEGFTKSKLRDRLDCGDRKAGAIIIELEERGDIEACTVQVKNKTSTRTANGYKAVPDGDANLFA